MPPPRFPHLQLIFKESGDAKLEGGGRSNPAVVQNQNDRPGHSAFIKRMAEGFSRRAKEQQTARREAGLPEIASGVSFVVQIPDEDDGAIEFIAEKLGLEIVAEYEDGFLIVSSDDLDLQRVIKLADEFAQSKRGSGCMARILDIDQDPLSGKRIERILDGQLLARWPFPDAEEFILDVSIEVAAYGRPDKPRISSRTRPEKKAQKEALYTANKEQYFQAWDEKRMQRETEIEEFVRHYTGEICSITDDSHIIEFPDSFSARIRMSGRGFKDLIANYPNLFEVTLPDEIQQPVNPGAQAADIGAGFELRAPAANSATVCIVDSGLEEGHRWLGAAIDKPSSRCFIPGKPHDEVADYVAGGGHGTRVAGACLYPQAVPKNGVHEPLFWLLNARILDENNGINSRVFPAELIREIVRTFKETNGTRIYNHSVASNACCRLSRMSVWAATIDLLSFQEDILVVQATGNIRDLGVPPNPGILDHLRANRPYPEYLYEAGSRLANPAQSLQALTVGSISADFFQDQDRRSVSPAHNPSSFSRTGFGMWESIKPEVVEFGGEGVIDNGTPPTITNPAAVCPELIRCTRNGGPPFDRDATGTSFAAPKVTHIAGHLASLLPEQGSLLYRALIVNAARWPAWAEEAPVATRPRIIRSVGYGVPDLARATENAENRVTLITEKTYAIRAGEGFVFGIPIPQELRPQGEDYRVRIDVTLSYAAEPRRTRKSRRGYLGVWLDWKAGKKRESFDTFQARALKETDSGDGIDDGNFSWVLGNKKERDGVTNGVCRKNGTVQKDWAIANSYDLPDTFGVVVRGHEGWDRANPNAIARFALVISFEALGAEVKIYERIQLAIEQEIRAQVEEVGIIV